MIKNIKKAIGLTNKKVIISTAGTSILGNYSNFFKDNDKANNILKAEFGNIEKEDFRKFINNKFEKLTLEKHLELIGFLSKDYKIKLSAEITTNYLYCKEFKIENCELHLITTNSEKAQMASKVVKNVLEYLFKDEGIKADITIHIINYLDARTDTKKDYIEKGIIEYFNKIIEIQKSSKNNKLVLNFTGGYKSLIPYSAYISGLLGLGLIYKFENSVPTENILEYPCIPIDKDKLSDWICKINDYSKRGKKIAIDYVKANNLEAFYDEESNDLSNFAKLLSKSILTRSER
jgi:hypothetical protein